MHAWGLLAMGWIAVICGCDTGERTVTLTGAGPAIAGRDGGPKLAVRMANYGKYEAGGWAHLQSLGVKYVFMSVPKPEDVPAAQKKLAEHGLTPVVMRGDTDLSKDEAVQDLAAQCATCRRMGVQYMFLSPKRRGVEKDVIFARLREAGEAARREGVTIALETHPDLGTNGDVHVATMQAINHPNVRVNFDCANITYYNKDTDAVAELRKVLPYLATVEVKDHNGQFETWNFPALGRGVVDIRGVVKLLKDNHYRGPITIEVEGVQGVERTEAQIQADIAESVEYLRKVIAEMYEG